MSQTGNPGSIKDPGWGKDPINFPKEPILGENPGTIKDPSWGEDPGWSKGWVRPIGTAEDIQE